MTRSVTTSDDVIDSRDVINRISDLESTLEYVFEEEGDNVDGETVSFDDWLRIVADDSHHSYRGEAEELCALRTLAEEAEGYADDWESGATLINAGYFAEYAKQLCDIPDLPDYVVVDWDATAENLKVDYTEVYFDGTAYLVR